MRCQLVTWWLFARNGVWYVDGRKATHPLSKHSLNSPDKAEASANFRQLDLIQRGEMGPGDVRRPGATSKGQLLCGPNGFRGTGAHVCCSAELASAHWNSTTFANAFEAAGGPAGRSSSNETSGCQPVSIWSSRSRGRVDGRRDSPLRQEKEEQAGQQ